MATGVVTLTGSTSGGADGARTFGPFSIQIAATVDETLPVALTNGATTVNVPSGATCMAILPPNMVAPGYVAPNPGYSGTLTLKGVSGDTGIPLSLKFPSLLSWDAATAPASVVIAATGTTTITVWFA